MNNIALAQTDHTFDVDAARRQFPILAAHGARQTLGLFGQWRLGAAPAMRDRRGGWLRTPHHANIHRGVHTLSQEATALYERRAGPPGSLHPCALAQRDYFCSRHHRGDQLVAQSYARPTLKAGDEVLITHLEHHANIVPWQMVCEQTGAKLIVAPMDASGEVHLDAVVALMNPRTKILACAHVSNALGTVLPCGA